MSLQVESPFTPKGDQPKAIQDIVEGLDDGLRFQTLLGATGTGKSVHYDEPITILLEDRSHYRGSIGHLIDTVLGNTQDEESLELPPPESWQVLAWNPETGDTSYQKVTGLSRHTSPEHLYQLRSQCGREVTITEDHSVWVLRQGQLCLLTSDQLQIGDALPIPLSIPEPEKPLESLNLLEVLKDSKTIYIDVRQVASQQERGFVKSWLGDFYTKPLGKRFALENNIKGHGVSFAAATALLERTSSPLESVLLQGKTYKQNAKLDITSELMTLWGTFLAEGHAAPRFILLSVREEEIQTKITHCLNTLGIAFSRRKDGDFVVASRIWRDVFAKLMGHHAGNKALPKCWTMLNNSNHPK
jgi:hypothetical protein